MRTKEPRRSRAQLEALAAQQAQEIERLQAELAAAQEKLRDRQIVLERAGTMADAAMQLNGVLRAADEAANQYLENIRAFTETQRRTCETIEQQTREKAEAMLRETEARCQAREREADAYWATLSEKLEQYCADHQELRGLLAQGRSQMFSGTSDAG